jgi:hypothetical protein
MFFYNLTIITEPSIAKPVIDRLLKIQVLSPKRFELLQLLDSPHEGTTYSLQFKAVDDTELGDFKTNISEAIQHALGQDFPNGKAVFFESVMQYIS